MKKIFLSLIFALAIPFAANASIIFSDDFDDQPNWDTSQNVSLITKWTSKLATNYGGNMEAGYINSDGAHGNGKGFIQYWDTRDPVGYAQDIALQKENLALPDEFYVGYWYQISPDWAWGNADRLKITRHYTNNNESVIPTWSNYCVNCQDNLGNTIWSANHCISGFAIGTNPAKRWGSCWEDASNGQWHYFIQRWKWSTGEWQIWFDGTDDTLSNPPGVTFSGTGWDQNYGIQLGGNVSGDGVGISELWTKYDDFIVATTKSEVETFLGVGNLDDTAPVSPTGLAAN